MYGVPPQGHLQAQARNFSLLKGTYIHMFLYDICCIYMSYHILFEGIRFVLSYSTQRWNAYVAGNLLEIKNTKNEACLQ